MFENIWITKKNTDEGCHIDGVPDFITELLRKRGVCGEEEIISFLNPTVDKLHDPFLLPDMDKAVERILAAVDCGEHITVFGDYDADGITATAVLYHFLVNYLGADIDYYIPNRLLEGYGLSDSSIDIISERGTTLIITVDCGIAALEEVKYAAQKEIDIVITDHHKCGDILPQAVASVNPMRPDSLFPYKTLAGCGVSFKLVEAISTVIGVGEEILEYLPIVAIGTIGDSMPLTGENRIIVSNGLKNIANTSWVGLHELIKQARGRNGESMLSATNITFSIVPRINAAGRMGDADCALELLLCDEPDKAEELAAVLSQKNTERQKIENLIFEEALKPENLKTSDLDSVVLALGYEWHHGVIGIVASKLSEKFSKPAIVLSCCEEECKDGIMRARGSARSVPGFNLYDALKENSDMIERFGGHEMAAGLTVEINNIKQLIEGINLYAEQHEIEHTIFNTYEIDAFLTPDMLTVENAEAVAMMEPFGQGNPCPLFCTTGFTDIIASKVGDGGKHLKMRFIYDDGTHRIGADGIAFNCGAYYSIASGIDKCCCVYNIEVNEWQNKRSVSLKVTDLIDGEYPEKYGDEYLAYGDGFYTGKGFKFEYKELIALFKVLKSFGERFSFNDLFKVRKILLDNGYNTTWFKIRHGVEIFCELGFIIKPKSGVYEFEKNIQNRSLDESAIYRELKRG